MMTCSMSSIVLLVSVRLKFLTMSFSKRIFDLLLSSIGLIIFIPVGGVIAILLRIDSPGKVIFSQQRLGRNGKYFNIHKFRKFPEDWGTKGSGVTTQGDVRMTTFGAFLERTKLDELPQLWNIFVGEMSFVGPRPESVRYNDLFEGEFEELLNFTPGIFGPNQVAFRNESEMYPLDEDPDQFYRRELFPKKARIDIEYFSKSTFISDIKWLIASVFGTLVGIVNWRRLKRRYSLILLLDLAIFEFAWLAAHVFRFIGFEFSQANYSVYITGAWLIPVVIFPIMLIGGCYRHPIRYFGLSDALRLTLVVGIAWLIAVFIQFGFFQRNISIGIAILSCMIFMVSLSLPRIWRREIWFRSNPQSIDKTRRALIYGASQRGSALATFLDKGFSGIEIIGFLDEDTDLRGRHINGFKVLGSWRDRNSLLDRYQVTELWITKSFDEVLNPEVDAWCLSKGIDLKSVDKI